MRAQLNISEPAVPMRIRHSLLLTAALLAGCVHAPTEHVCNEKQLESAGKPPHRRKPLVTVDSGITFSGSERTVKVTAQSFDRGGICSIPQDQLTVTWKAEYAAELPLSPKGNQAIFRPTHAGIYYVRLTVERPPLEPRSELFAIPVITPEQNAIWHLKNTVEMAFAREKAPPPLIEDLAQYKDPLRAAYARLEAGELSEAIPHLDEFRRLLLVFHRGQSSWAAVLAETDNMIEGLWEEDHRFDNLAVATGGSL